jgi:uncharacterized protein
MEAFKKYFLAGIWVILTILIGAIIGHYLNLSWILFIFVIFSLLVFSIYWFFFQRFVSIEKNIGFLKSKIEGISDIIREALGTLDSEKRLSWLLFWSKVQQLYAKIEGSNFDPDIVISIGRSGAVVGGMFASLMGAKKHVSFDRNVIITKKLGFPEERNIEIDICVLPNKENLSGKKILGVMSECTSGNTLQEINQFFTAIPDVELKTAVIFCKPNVYTCPHFYVDKTEKWPELPFRIEGQWKNYYPRIEEESPGSENK